MPQQQGNPIVGKVKFSIGSGSWKSVVITPYVNDQLAFGDKMISLEIVGTSNATLAGLESREGVNGAYILFSYPLIPTTGVSISPTEFELTVGSERVLEAVVTPADAYNPAIVWSSSDPAVAVVDPLTGKVKAVGVGITTITVTTEEGGHSAASLLTVKPLLPPAAPVIVSPAGIVLTKSGQVVVSLKAESHAIVKVRNGAEVVATLVGAGDNPVSVTLPTLADGVYSLTATATDAAGNESEPAVIPTIKVDTNAPAAPTVVSPSAVVLTKSASIVVMLKAEQGTAVLVRNGAEVVATLVGAGDNAVSVTLPTLADGVYSLTATATDAAGNESEPVVIPTIKVDTNAPAAPTIMAPTNPIHTKDRTLVLRFLAEEGSTIKVFWNQNEIGRGIGAGNIETIIEAVELAKGKYELTVVAIDAAGNESVKTISPEIHINGNDEPDMVKSKDKDKKTK
ncbi:Ig-like domain-containing protein [Paenibacillus roseipurpureus]|uniref:Ig-like domain-containing protein n=1 Tax=Paenibacillus roseopurpureus TaxID=2918901 RepID=A0AA96RLV7_9BACL|nr:Ig-like domain-containing protein [Paenibacillus sp. MBLB1832]WNR46085.1 Ig-like domain-containing protein [Paenibacillus sp. MBLB1832]